MKGVITALVTPFNSDNTVDYIALKELVEFQIENGISGLLPMGTTGESPTVSNDEHTKIIQSVISQTNGRVPVIAGTGSNCTSEAVTLTQKAAEVGANYSLQVAPYYNKPNQEGFYRHFSEIADNCEIPIILYNIPGRSGKNIEPETILKLAKHPNIVGVKEASGSMGQVMEIVEGRPEGFRVYSGDDNLILPIIGLGGEGVISVASNIIPGEMTAFVKTALAGNQQEAMKEHYRLYPLFKSMFIDTNPIPVKTVMAIQGKIKEIFRLPICPISAELKDQLIKIVKDFNL